MTFDELEKKVELEIIRIGELKPSQSNMVEWLRLKRFIDNKLMPYIGCLKKRAVGQMNINSKN